MFLISQFDTGDSCWFIYLNFAREAFKYTVILAAYLFNLLLFI